MDAAIPLITGIISLVFAFMVLGQYRERHKPYQLLWAIGLLLYAGASILQGLWNLGVYAPSIFRFWYLFGAMLTAAYLGMGSLYLHIHTPKANIVMVGLVVFTLVSIFTALQTDLQANVSLLREQPLSSIVPDTDSLRYYPPTVSILTICLNSFGAIALSGSAIWSSVSYLRRKAPIYRVLSALLIAIGSFVSAAGGTFERFDVPQPHNIALLIGVVLIFLGFLRSNEAVFDYRMPFIRRST